jgi:hypothetical protein
MKTAGATLHENVRYNEPQTYKSPFANMTPSAALTKHYFNIKSRIKDDALRTSSGAFVNSNTEFSKQKSELDKVYTKYKKLYSVEK